MTPIEAVRAGKAMDEARNWLSYARALRRHAHEYKRYLNEAQEAGNHVREARYALWCRDAWNKAWWGIGKARQARERAMQ